jgi:hypothetical protein
VNIARLRGEQSIRWAKTEQFLWSVYFQEIGWISYGFPCLVGCGKTTVSSNRTAKKKKGIFFDYSTDRQFQALILN